MQNIIFITVITIIIFIASPPKAHAAALDLGIEPPLLQIEALPSAKIQSPITIENFADKAVELDIVIRPFKPSPKENGEILFLDASYLHPGVEIRENNLPITALILAPGQQKTLILHLDVNKNERPSDYYFSVVFISKHSKSDQNNHTISSGGIAANVLVSIGPTEKAKGEIEEFSAPFFIEQGPVALTLRLKNTGNHMITPKGVILIENMFGQTIGKVELLPVYVLSQSIRGIPSTFSSTKAIWYESFLLGPYKAKLTLALSDQGPVFTRAIRFAAFPLEFVAGAIILLGILIFVAYRIRSRMTT